MMADQRPASAPHVGGGGSTIQVVVRLRPLNSTERGVPVITARTEQRSVSAVRGKDRKQIKSVYTFDDVFGAFSTQEEVFDATVKPVIRDVMRGFESTVFAYGQTGTGKTHTMEGSLESPEKYGVIPRSAQAIFEHLKRPEYREQRVVCSYLEIYNEELRDLLSDGAGGGAAKLEIMEGKGGTFCRGLTEKRVHSAADVLRLMQKAQHSRMIGETKMNSKSSRSHCLFTIQVHGKVATCAEDGGDGELLSFNGKLHMVDLAGSECAKSAGNDKSCPEAAAREKERKNINQSLLTLGRVITILKEKSTNRNVNARIPYRDSKLTRVLQESLGGRCKTIIIATLSPSITAVEESLSTLNYAHAANGIVNKPISSSLIALGEGMPGATSDSKSSSAPPTIESWQEMEMRLHYMQTQVDEAQAALTRKHHQQLELQDRADKAEAELLESKQRLYAANAEIKRLNSALEAETAKRKVTEAELRETRIRLARTEAVLTATRATEAALTSEARALIAKLEDVIADRVGMHELVVTQRNAESQRKQAARHFQQAALDVLNRVESSFAHLVAGIEAGQTDALKLAEANHEVGRLSLSESQKLLSDVARNVSAVTDGIRTQLAGEEGIVPAVAACSTSASGAMGIACKEFARGEKLLEESHDQLRRRLEQCVRALEGQASSMQKSTNQALQEFETRVVESKNAITHMVMRIKTSLTDLADAKTEKAKALDSLVEQWRDQSLANAETTANNTTTSSDSLKNAYESFENETHKHNEVKASLEDQRSFLENAGSSHVQTLAEQSSLINTRRQKFAESHDIQSKLRDEVMNSIVSFVSSEFEKLAKMESNHFHVLEKDDVELASANEKIRQTAEQVVNNISSTNQFVSEKAADLCKNDVKAGEAMKSTLVTLETVTLASKAQHTITTDYASKSQAVVSEMKHLDGQNSEIAKNTERDGKATSTSLVNAVFKPASSEMKKTLQTGLNAMAYVTRDVVPSVGRDLDGVAESRKPVAQQVNQSTEDAQTQLLDMADRVTKLANAQHEAAKQLGDETHAVSSKHKRESVPKYNADLESCRSQLVDALTTLTKNSSHLISEGRAQSSIIRKSVDEFVEEKMRCNEPVDPAPSLKEVSFDRDLSSTPAEDEILAGAELDTALPSEDLVADSTAATTASGSESPMLPEVSTMHNATENDVKGKTSVASLPSPRLPSPRLSYRDINTDQNEPSGPKAQKYNRHTSNTTSISRKNKCPSGLPAPSKQTRKRMKR